MADFKVGDIIDGTVTKLVNFGAFVRVRDGLEGLIHISELSHQRVAHPGDVVHEGQTLKLKIIRLDSERHRLGLSLKQAEEPPARPARAGAPASARGERPRRAVASERGYTMSDAVQEPEGGIDNTLAAAFAQVRQQMAAAEADGATSRRPRPPTRRAGRGRRGPEAEVAERAEAADAEASRRSRRGRRLAETRPSRPPRPTTEAAAAEAEIAEAAAEAAAADAAPRRGRRATRPTSPTRCRRWPPTSRRRPRRPADEPTVDRRACHAEPAEATPRPTQPPRTGRSARTPDRAGIRPRRGPAGSPCWRLSRRAC